MQDIQRVQKTLKRLKEIRRSKLQRKYKMFRCCKGKKAGRMKTALKLVESRWACNRVENNIRPFQEAQSEC